MISDTMQKATLKIYDLPYGFQLHEHYWFSQYGEIDDSDIRFSVEKVTDETTKRIYVHECYNYEHAMVMFLTQIQAEQAKQFDDLVQWICKLLDIKAW